MGSVKFSCEVEKMFNEAKIDPRLTSHPYSGLARIYLTEARIVTEINLQLEFILAAAQECNYLERNVAVSSESQAIKRACGTVEQ